MSDQQLVQRVLQVIRNAHLQMAKGGDLGGLARNPAQPLAQTEDVRVDGEARPLQTEEQHAGGCLGADAGVFDEFGHDLVCGETGVVQMVEREDVLVCAGQLVGFGLGLGGVLESRSVLIFSVHEVENRLEVLAFDIG